MQQEGCAVRFGEILHRAMDDEARGVVDLFRRFVKDRERLPETARASAAAIVGAVREDDVLEPGAELGAVPQIGKARQGIDQALLGHVEGVVRIAEGAIGHAERQTAVPVQKPAGGKPVPGKRAVDELYVGFVRHHHLGAANPRKRSNREQNIYESVPGVERVDQQTASHTESHICDSFTTQ